MSAKNDVQCLAKNLTMEFNHKTKNWDAIIKREEGWKNEFRNTSSIYIPAKKILSNSYNQIMVDLC